MTKTRIAIIIISAFISQYVLSYYFGITLKHTPGTWWVVTVLFSLITPFFQRALANWITLQVELHKERIQNRHNYELFKSGVKDGLFTTDEQMERENRRIVK